MSAFAPYTAVDATVIVMDSAAAKQTARTALCTLGSLCQLRSQALKRGSDHFQRFGGSVSWAFASIAKTQVDGYATSPGRKLSSRRECVEKSYRLTARFRLIFRNPLICKQLCLVAHFLLQVIVRAEA